MDNILSDAIMDIKFNSISFPGTILQISNITSLSIAPAPKKRFPIWAVIIAIIGVLGAGMNTDYSTLFIILLCVGLIVIVYVLYKNSFDNKYLVIKMNSGEIFLFACDNNDFLYKAIDLIKESFNKKWCYTINFHDCKITSSQIGTQNSQLVERK